MSDVTGSSLGVGSVTQRAGKSFDVRDQEQTLSLLRHIHQSPLQPEEKNELRDALFAFKSSDEPELTKEMVSLFSEHDFPLVFADEPKIETSLKMNPVVKVTPFGMQRPSPRFGQVAYTSKIEAVPKEDAPLEKQEVPEVKKEELVEVQAMPNTSKVPEVPPAEVISTVDPTVRIKEIKKEVNALVGNPVNLIDVHNEVGREYMNALLDAMKKNNGGSPEEVQDAMKRLEQSFVAVKEAVGSEGLPSKQEVAVEVVPEVEKKEVSEVISTEEVVETQPTVQEKEETAPVSGFTSVHTSHVEEKENLVVPSPVPGQEVASAVPGKEMKKNKEVNGQVPVSGFAAVSQADVEPAVPAASVPKPTQPVAPAPPVSVPVPNAEVSPVEDSQGGIMSVAKQKQIQDIMTAKKQESAATDKQKEEAMIASMDPLMTPDVTNGLQQLLSEWSLFKSSGIFGTGPSGAEHPLYKKLSKLNMTAVVAGRYEGATPQIKRSITDYMNGWRYEEGILQEQGELFEHYLRRVIKHIISKRKK